LIALGARTASSAKEYLRHVSVPVFAVNLSAFLPSGRHLDTADEAFRAPSLCSEGCPANGQLQFLG